MFPKVDFSLSTESIALIHVSFCLEKLQKLLTLEGMIFVAKFAFLIIPGYWLLFKAVRLFAIVFRAVIKLAFFPLNCIFGVGKVFKKVTSMAKQLKGIKMKKKQK